MTVNPVNIAFGAALANSQLAGSATAIVGASTANVPGAFVYTSAAGSVLGLGGGQTENVTFTPTDTTDYATTTTTVMVNVAQATPGITHLSAVNITYGTALASSQLSGTASVPGTFTFTTAAGSLLGAGSGQMEDVTFTPNDTTDYTTASTTVAVNVTQATPVVTSVNAVPITYGTALANGQLIGTATFTVNGVSTAVPGTFSYSSAAGSIPNAGNGQTDGVTFTPTDTTDYTTAMSNVTVNVATFVPTVTVTDAGGAFKNSPFAASGSVTGANGANLGTPTFTYYSATDTTFANPLSGAPSAIGRYVVVGSYAASGDYAAGATIAGFDINNGTPPINPAVATAAQPASVNVGASIADMATVTGASPTGVVTFSLYNNTAAVRGTALFTDTEALIGGVATSKGYTTTATAIGTDYWVVTYSGDAENNPLTTAATANPVTVGGSLVVNSTGDGPTATGNTLRDAVAYADTLGAGTHAITFDPALFATAQTITLSSALGALTLSNATGNTTITAPAAGVTISGGNSVGLFTVNSGVTASFSNLTLIDGKSTNGGAINDKGTLTISGSTLTGNNASQLGGAIVVTGTLTLDNSTLASNSASLSGGAIEDAGTVTVLDSTLTANDAGATYSGGAIDNGGGGYTLEIGGSIVAGNSAGYGPNVSNAVTSLGNNLIGATDGSSGWVSSDLTGTGANPLNPLLGALSNNGGPTLTFPLLTGSPAIGTSAMLNGITTDQRGFTRPNSNPDIGAYQTEPSVSVSVGSPVVNGDNPNGLTNRAQRSMVEDIVYTFSAPVVIPNANAAFTVVRAGPHPGTAPTTLTATAVPGSNGTQWAVTLTGGAAGVLGSIANGEYSITINPSGVFAASDGITQLAAGRTDQFYRLFGDINGDETVNAADNLQLKKALTNYNPAFDSNADGTVNAADNLAFKKDLTVAYFGDGFVPTI